MGCLLLLVFSCDSVSKRSEGVAQASTRTQEESTLEIAPDGLSVLVQKGNLGFAWYALPSGKPLREGHNRGSVTLLRFSQNGLAWLKDKAAIVDAYADGSEKEVPVPVMGKNWLDMYVAVDSQVSANLLRSNDTAVLQIFHPIGEPEPAFTQEVPLAEEYELLSDDGMRILAVRGSARDHKDPWVAFFARKADGLAPLSIVRERHSPPAMGDGAAAWAQADGIRLLYADGHLTKLPGNLQDSVHFFAEGTQLLVTRTEAELKHDKKRVKARVFSVADHELLQEAEYELQKSQRLFIGPDADLNAIHLSKAGKPLISRLSAK